MNGIALAIALAMIKLAISSIEQHDHISRFWFIRIRLRSLLVGNAVLLVCSRTDRTA